MKKYLLGLTAFVMAVGLSSYSTVAKATNGKKINYYYWFKIKPGYAPYSEYSNDEVEFISEGFFAPTGICTTFPKLYSCVVGFEGHEMKWGTDSLLDGSYLPSAFAEKRPEW